MHALAICVAASFASQRCLRPDFLASRSASLASTSSALTCRGTVGCVWTCGEAAVGRACGCCCTQLPPGSTCQRQATHAHLPDDHDCVRLRAHLRVKLELRRRGAVLVVVVQRVGAHRQQGSARGQPANARREHQSGVSVRVGGIHWHASLDEGVNERAAPALAIGRHRRQHHVSVAVFILARQAKYAFVGGCASTGEGVSKVLAGELIMVMPARDQAKHTR